MCHDPEVTRHPAEFSPGVSLTCGVESYPAARSYRWQYNSSQGSFQIPKAKSMMSFMNYAVSEAGGTEGEPAGSEQAALHRLRQTAAKNKVLTSLIGQGYYGTVTPPVT